MARRISGSQDGAGRGAFHGRWSKKPGFVRHGFTHFELETEVYVANFQARPNGEGMWLTREEVRRAALPTVMRKLIHHALDESARCSLNCARGMPLGYFACSR